MSSCSKNTFLCLITNLASFLFLYSMSAGKLMKRIVTPDHINYDQKDVVSIAREIHESTYGISSDPLLLFATVFSALIHDADREYTVCSLTHPTLDCVKTCTDTCLSFLYKPHRHWLDQCRARANEDSTDVFFLVFVVFSTRHATPYFSGWWTT